MRRAIPIAVGACLTVWALARWVIYDFFQLGDTRVYEHVARLMDAGAMPYVDFDVEYPPLASGLFWLVGRVPGGDYQLAFSLAMAACLAATGVATVVIARKLGLSAPRTWIAIGTVALTPVLLGTLVQARYDLAVTALVAWVVAAAIHDRFRWAWTLLALAIAIKLVPVVLVPALVVWHRHRRPAGGATAGVIGCAAGVAATFAPFVLAAPRATWRIFAYHLERPAEMGSLTSAIVQATGLDFRSVQTHGSDGVSGSASNLLAATSSLLTAVAVVACAMWMVRALRRSQTDPAVILVTTVAATLTAAVAFGKVLSPQYMVWLLPMVLLVPGVRGRIAAAVFAVSLPITQLVFPLLFTSLVERSAPLPLWLLVVRNASLVVIVVLLWPRAATLRPHDRHTHGAVPTAT